ncbi:MAG: creatininase family protein, partial [Anaerolineae bacterium]|nr:creatininase family protein [Anaerolineae bacterium]
VLQWACIPEQKETIMPEIIHYENLTWPEVAALPRDLPLVLPLGAGFAPERIADALRVEHLCLLPALPYGWPGSILPVSLPMLRRVIAGIFSGPLEEQFTRLVLVHDGAEDLAGTGFHQIHLEREATPALIPLAATPQRVILIPCGHTEQHGYHLPMNTDTVIIGTIATQTAAAIPDEAESLPVLPYGVSMYRSSFAGTFNMGGRVFEDFLLEVIDVLVERGADRFYLMSGHGGNCSFLTNVVKYAGDRHHPIFAATTWLHTSGHLGAPAIEQYRRSQRGGMGHAGELETAYMLHLRPEHCHMERVIDEIDFISSPNYYMDWIEGGSLNISAPWEDDTQTGSYGAGSVATAENGDRWLKAAVQEKIDHVREIHDQARRRLARRRLIRRAAQTIPK